MNQSTSTDKCPKCGSEKRARSSLGKKSPGMSIILLLLGAYWFIRGIYFVASAGSLTVGALILFVLGLSFLAAGVTGFAGTYKCKECGTSYK